MTEHSELISFTNIVARINIDALKILMRLKIGKKLRTASLNTKFTGSYKKKSVLRQIVELIKSWLVRKDMQKKEKNLTQHNE